MAKKKRKGKNIYPTLFKLLRIGSLVAPGIHSASITPGSVANKAAGGFLGYAGLDYRGQDFKWARLGKHWTPFVATTLVTTLIPKINGLIRKLG